jgi:two-component system CheB/CheR fusion protein
VLRNLLDSNELEEAKQFIAEIEEDLHESVRVIRNLSIDLSPPVLHNEGLYEAVYWLAAQMQQQHGLIVVVQAEAEWPLLGSLSSL